jgi:hypothetical protein
MWLTDGGRGRNPDRLVERSSRTGLSADISFAHHGVLFLGELTRREARRSQSSVSDQQVDHKHDQQNTADTDATAISPPGIAESAPEQEEQYDNNQDQIHPFLR